jgi:hypothetical protein
MALAPGAVASMKRGQREKEVFTGGLMEGFCRMFPVKEMMA